MTGYLPAMVGSINPAMLAEVAAESGCDLSLQVLSTMLSEADVGMFGEAISGEIAQTGQRTCPNGRQHGQMSWDDCREV